MAHRIDLNPPPDERRCRAISARTGERCTNYAQKQPGTDKTMCYAHATGLARKNVPPPVPPAVLQPPTDGGEYAVPEEVFAAKEQRERDLRRPEKEPPPGFVWERQYEDPEHPWAHGPRKIRDEQDEIFRWVLIPFDRMVERVVQERVVRDGERRDRVAEARNDMERLLTFRHLQQVEDPRTLPTDYREIGIPELDGWPVDLDSDVEDKRVAAIVQRHRRG